VIAGVDNSRVSMVSIARAVVASKAMPIKNINKWKNFICFEIICGILYRSRALATGNSCAASIDYE
jgi:hypothetical protein